MRRLPQVCGNRLQHDCNCLRCHPHRRGIDGPPLPGRSSRRSTIRSMTCRSSCFAILAQFIKICREPFPRTVALPASGSERPQSIRSVVVLPARWGRGTGHGPRLAMGRRRRRRRSVRRKRFGQSIGFDHRTSLLHRHPSRNRLWSPFSPLHKYRIRSTLVGVGRGPAGVRCFGRGRRGHSCRVRVLPLAADAAARGDGRRPQRRPLGPRLDRRRGDLRGRPRDRGRSPWPAPGANTAASSSGSICCSGSARSPCSGSAAAPARRRRRRAAGRGLLRARRRRRADRRLQRGTPLRPPDPGLGRARRLPLSAVFSLIFPAGSYLGDLLITVLLIGFAVGWGLFRAGPPRPRRLAARARRAARGRRPAPRRAGARGGAAPDRPRDARRPRQPDLAAQPPRRRARVPA